LELLLNKKREDERLRGIAIGDDLVTVGGLNCDPYDPTGRWDAFGTSMSRPSIVARAIIPGNSSPHA